MECNVFSGLLMQKHMHNPEDEMNGCCGGERSLKKLIS